ncbi:hypothetical protein E3Q22_04417 [Wallemia mellicola]|uniref:Uncharacterized protein n=1 Tax=Wallemia mellicola TaxID=1708541 RepID=A0A4T0LRS1_9BASI|nr:hypothetical protein E3Q22_04417 [Wallemia mellicola]
MSSDAQPSTSYQSTTVTNIKEEPEDVKPNIIRSPTPSIIDDFIPRYSGTDYEKWPQLTTQSTKDEITRNLKIKLRNQGKIILKTLKRSDGVAIDWRLQFQPHEVINIDQQNSQDDSIIDNSLTETQINHITNAIQLTQPTVEPTSEPITEHINQSESSKQSYQQPSHTGPSTPSTISLPKRPELPLHTKRAAKPIKVPTNPTPRASVRQVEEIRSSEKASQYDREKERRVQLRTENEQNRKLEERSQRSHDESLRINRQNRPYHGLQNDHDTTPKSFDNNRKEVYKMKQNDLEAQQREAEQKRQDEKHQKEIIERRNREIQQKKELERKEFEKKEREDREREALDFVKNDVTNNANRGSKSKNDYRSQKLKRTGDNIGFSGSEDHDQPYQEVAYGINLTELARIPKDSFSMVDKLSDIYIFFKGHIYELSNSGLEPTSQYFETISKLGVIKKQTKNALSQLLSNNNTNGSTTQSIDHNEESNTENSSKHKKKTDENKEKNEKVSTSALSSAPKQKKRKHNKEDQSISKKVANDAPEHLDINALNRGVNGTAQGYNEDNLEDCLRPVVDRRRKKNDN